MAVATAVARVATSLHCGWLRRQRSRRGLRLGPRRLHRWATRYGCGWPTRGGGEAERCIAGRSRRAPVDGRSGGGAGDGHGLRREQTGGLVGDTAGRPSALAARAGGRLRVPLAAAGAPREPASPS